MTRSAGDSFIILVLFLASWAAVNIPVLASPLGSNPVVDGEWHHRWAVEVSKGDVFLYAPYFRAPLYPWLLGGWYAVFGSAFPTGAILSMIFGALASVLLHRLALGTTSRGAAFAIGAIWALWGTWLLYSGFLLIAPLYILLLTASFHQLGRRPDTPLPWFLLGAACIARPGAVLLFPVSLYLFRPRPRSWGAWCIPVAAVWAVNLLAGDPGTVISSQGGINFYIGSGPRADGVTAFAPPGERVPSESLPYVDNVWAASLAPLPEGARPSAVSSHWTRKTLDFIVSKPLESGALLFGKLMYLVSPVEIPCNYDVYYLGRYSPLARVLVTGPPMAFPGLLLWLFLPGALVAGRLSLEDRRLLLWILTLSAGLVPFFITARFRLPIIPFLLLFLVSRFMRKPRLGILTAPLGLAAGIGLSVLTGASIPVSGVNMPFQDGMAHFNAGNRNTARVLFMEAWERASMRTDGVDLNGTDALYNLGVLAMLDGQFEDAVFWFEKALAWNPDHGPSRENLRALTRQWQ